MQENVESRTREREAGIAALVAASRLCQAVRREMRAGGGQGALDKEDRSPVTVADFGAQALVCRALRESFPGDAIVAEEDSASLRQPENAAHLVAVTRFVAAELGDATEASVCSWIDAGGREPAWRYWVLDPIDGTKGFLRGDQYAIALALIEEGRPRWAFLGCPALEHQGRPGAIFVAREEGGALAFTLDGDEIGPIRVADTSRASRARLVESVEAAHTNHGLSAELRQLLGIERPSLGMDSQAKYAAVARGDAEIYLRAPNPRTPDYRERIWDHAAGWLVVREAGGAVTDVEGRPLDWSRGSRLEANRGVLATSGRIHGQVLEALSSLRPPT